MLLLTKTSEARTQKRAEADFKTAENAFCVFSDVCISKFFTDD